MVSLAFELPNNVFGQLFTIFSALVLFHSCNVVLGLNDLSLKGIIFSVNIGPEWLLIVLIISGLKLLDNVECWSVELLSEIITH